MKTILILIVLSFTVESCTTYQYVSSKQTVPLFSKKNDLKAELAISPFNTCSADIAYSFSNHIGFFCNANYYSKSYGPNEFLIDYNQSSVSNSAESNMRLKEIESAVKRLPDIFKNPFVMYFEGYKYNEISDFLQEPLGTVKSRIHFARKLLKAEISRY